MLKKIILMLTITLMSVLSTTYAAEDQSQSTESYEYVSRDYNYSIICPKRPNVVPASIVYDDPTKKGEVLVFENEGYYIKRGWIFLFDAFDSTMIPNFNKDSKKLIDQYIEVKQKDGFEGLTLIEVTKGNKGVFGITAREIEIDEDGDGTIDGVAVADKQEAVVFFRSELGRCISVELMGDDLNEAAIKNFRTALATYKDVNPNEKKSDDKKDKKSKKDKKDKK